MLISQQVEIYTGHLDGGFMDMYKDKFTDQCTCWKRFSFKLWRFKK